MDSSRFFADIALVGCFGYPNLGDELLLKAWIESILKERPISKIIVECHVPSNISAILGDYNGRVKYQDALWRVAWAGPDNALESLCFGYKILESQHPEIKAIRFMLSELSKVKLIHFVGGGYIRAGWNKHYSVLTSAIAFKEKFGIKLSMSGQGFIPFDNELSSLVLASLEKFDHVSTRDRPSYEIIKNLQCAYHASFIDDTFLFSKSPLSRDFIPSFPEERLTESIISISGNNDLIEQEITSLDSDKRILVCIQADIMNVAIHNYLWAKVHELYKTTFRQICLLEFLPKHDLETLRPLELIAPIRVISFEELWNRDFTINEDDICIGTRFHFHLLAARAGAKGIFGSADNYYGVKHDSLIEIGSQWQNVDLYQSIMPTLVKPNIDETVLCAMKKVELLKVLSLLPENSNQYFLPSQFDTDLQLCNLCDLVNALKKENADLIQTIKNSYTINKSDEKGFFIRIFEFLLTNCRRVKRFWIRVYKKTLEKIPH